LASNSHHHCPELFGVNLGVCSFSSLRKDMEPNFTNIPTDFHRFGSPTSPIKIRPKPPIGVTIALAIIGLVIFVVVVLLLIASCSPSRGPVAVTRTATPTQMQATQTANAPTMSTDATPSPGPSLGVGGNPDPSPTPIPGDTSSNTPLPGVTPSPALPQTFLASDTSHWHYSGVWNFATRGICESDTCEISKQSGATASVTFTGTRVTLLGGRNKNGGIGSLSIVSASGDPMGSAIIDCYSATHGEATLYVSKPLPQGSYTLTITVTGTADTGSGSSKVFLDSIVINP
jgi:hypothetical protein